MIDDTNGSEPPDATDGGGEQAPQGQGRPDTPADPPPAPDTKRGKPRPKRSRRDPRAIWSIGRDNRSGENRWRETRERDNATWARRREVARLRSAGVTQEKIAKQLGVAVITVARDERYWWERELERDNPLARGLGIIARGLQVYTQTQAAFENYMRYECTPPSEREPPEVETPESLWIYRQSLRQREEFRVKYCLPALNANVANMARMSALFMFETTSPPGQIPGGRLGPGIVNGGPDPIRELISRLSANERDGLAADVRRVHDRLARASTDEPGLPR